MYMLFSRGGFIFNDGWTQVKSNVCIALTHSSLSRPLRIYENFECPFQVCNIRPAIKFKLIVGWLCQQHFSSPHTKTAFHNLRLWMTVGTLSVLCVCLLSLMCCVLVEGRCEVSNRESEIVFVGERECAGLVRMSFQTTCWLGWATS